MDGASIPAPLWSVVGLPYTGEYRRASVVHDVACNDPAVPREAADKMFYYACLAGGCSRRQAQLLYFSVRIGAWVPNIRLWSDEAVSSPTVTRKGLHPVLTEQSMRTTFHEIEADISSQPETLDFEELERLVNRYLALKSQQ
jgi:hypothetical protein